MNNKISKDVNYPKVLFPKSFNRSMADDMKNIKPKQKWEDKFDEMFNRIIVLDVENAGILGKDDTLHFDKNNSQLGAIKTFISQLLQEREEELAREVEKFVWKNDGTEYESTVTNIEKKAHNKALQDIINLIKKQ